MSVQNLPASDAEDTPQLTVEMDAIMLMVGAYIDAEGRKKGQRLLTSAAKILAKREEDERTIVDLVRPKESAERARVRRQTRAWFRQNLPVWIARLDAS